MEVILILVKLLQKHYDFKAYLGKHEISTRTSYRIVIPDRYREQCVSTRLKPLPEAAMPQKGSAQA